MRLMLLALLITLPAYAIDSASITKNTLEALPHCLHYRLKGWCHWWVTAVIPYPAITPKITHYRPDLIVIVHNRKNDNPWKLSKTLLDKISYQGGNRLVQGLTHIAMAGGNHSAGSVHDQGVYFKEVDIIGNPITSLSIKIITIPSTITPLMPYFSSMADALSWRLSPENFLPKTWSPRAPVIGPSIASWGNLYPRDGFVIASNDAKAAAVIALRAAHLITHDHHMHLAKSLSNHCGSHCHVSPIEPQDKHTLWQMILPSTTHHCAPLDQKKHWGNKIAKAAQDKSHGTYVWIVWRRYSGCVPLKHAKFIGET
jgi:integrating conjugative element protein (TIGR03756 family)